MLGTYALVVLSQIIQLTPINPTCAWNQEGTTLTEVQGYTYKYSIDGGNETTFSGVVCSGSGKSTVTEVVLFTCQATLMYTIPGEHTIYLVTSNKEGSAKSEPTKFTLETIGIGMPNPVIITIK